MRSKPLIVPPLVKDRLYDVVFEKIILSIKRSLSSNDDDCLLVCAGDTGTGKTRLMFHAYELYAGGAVSIDFVALNKSDFSKVIHRASSATGPRFAGYDEGNVNKRDAMTKWNRRLIDLYLNIRGLNIFHWWNNPSAELLDKPFIEERVKGLIFIFTKGKNKPRFYYYFTKDGLLDLLEEKGNLKKRTLQKCGPRYAYSMGWFRDYKGVLLEPYQALKQDRMTQKVQEFVDDFGDDVEKMRLGQYEKHVGVSAPIVNKIFLYGVEAGLLKEKEHYVLVSNGQRLLLKSGVDVMDYIFHNDLYKKQRATIKRLGLARVPDSIYPPRVGGGL